MARDVTPRTPRNGFVTNVETPNRKRVAIERPKSTMNQAEEAWDKELIPARTGEISWSEAMKNALRAYDEVMNPDRGKVNGYQKH